MRKEIAIYQVKDFENTNTVEQAIDKHFMFTTRIILNETKKAYELAGNAIIMSNTKGKWVAKSMLKKIGNMASGMEAYAIPMFINL
jgi:hypothetical protein